jgi:hypothetical protein
MVMTLTLIYLSASAEKVISSSKFREKIFKNYLDKLE